MLKTITLDDEDWYRVQVVLKRRIEAAGDEELKRILADIQDQQLRGLSPAAMLGRMGGKSTSGITSDAKAAAARANGAKGGRPRKSQEA